MTSESILYETHCHTPLCKHAVGEPEEYAAVARRRRLRGIIFTCHNPMPEGFSPRVRMSPAEFPDYLAMVDRARQTWAGKVDVRLGIECDYFPGYEDWLTRQTDENDFHYVLGSVHPQIAEYRERFWSEDAVEFQRTYFTLLADAAETGLFDCLSHPDLVKNNRPGAWRPERIMDTIRASLDRIAASGAAMELNTSGANKTVAEMNPFPAMLEEMRAREIPVVIGADAHEPGRVGDGFRFALDLLADVGYDEVSYFLNRRRQAVRIETARASLAEDFVA